MIRSAADIAPSHHRNHVVKRGNVPAGAGKCRRSRRVRVNNRANLAPRVVDIAVEPPFARGAAPAKPPAIELDEGNILIVQRCVIHPTRTHQETPLTAAHADIARSTMNQTTARQLQTGRDNHCAQVSAVRGGIEIGHSPARRSGYSCCSPARLAGHIPRSVIKPVTRRAGVTSKARLSAALPSGTNLTVSIRPDELWPVICVTSCGDRSSIGIADPASTDQSIVLTGNAA